MKITNSKKTIKTNTICPFCVKIPYFSCFTKRKKYVYKQVGYTIFLLNRWYTYFAIFTSSTKTYICCLLQCEANPYSNLLKYCVKCTPMKFAWYSDFQIWLGVCFFADLANICLLYQVSATNKPFS